MSLVTIGNERWDFGDSNGSEIRLPREGKRPIVELPREWRVFGPYESVSIEYVSVQEEAELAALEEIRSIPDSLRAGKESKAGKRVALDGDTLDLGKHFGGHAMGQQAYCFAELEQSEDLELTVGAGADYWMQWWIDGEPVFDTLAGGNRTHPPTLTDHSFCRHLAAGRHILTVRLISGPRGWLLKAGCLTREEELSVLTFTEGWKFLPEINEIHPPASADWTHAMAICVDHCMADETIECEFQKCHHSGTFGIILGAQDSGHYYYAQVPWHGQLPRARGVWAAVSRTDGSGYVRNLSLQLIPNVPAYMDKDWLSLKVQRSGNSICMWLNGVKGPCITDATYGPGRVGIAGFSLYRVRNLKIDGRRVDGAPWPGGDKRGRPWFHIEPDVSLGDVQASTNLCKIGDEILAAINTGRNTSVHDTNAKWTTYSYRSRDCGRAWERRVGSREGKMGFTAPEGATFPGFPLQVGSGTIRAWTWNDEKNTIVYSDSTDKAVTWSELQSCSLNGDWRKFFESHNSWWLNWVEKLRDGSLLAVMNCGNSDIYDTIKDKGGMTWPRCHAEAWSSLSPDMGLSWSAPVPNDHAAGRPDEPGAHPNMDMSEPTAAQLPSGRIVLLARPCASPFMWQTHSDDGGRTWSIARYAPFTGHGYANLVCTESGYLVVVKRGPGLALNISTDGGVNWDQGTMIDYAGSFNGRMIEVEPDVVLVMYPEAMDEIRPAFVRAQLIRITPDGPLPIRCI